VEFGQASLHSTDGDRVCDMYCDHRPAFDVRKSHIGSRQILQLLSTGITAYLSSAAILHCSNVGL